MVLEIFFAAGCFWGVEKNFEQIEGVVDVESGYSGGNYDNPTYRDVLENRNLKGGGFLETLRNIANSNEETEVEDILINHTETVKVVYDPDIVSTEYLIKNFWQIHNPTQTNGQGNDIGNNYRSAIYWTTPEQQAIALQTREEFQKLLNEKGYGDIVTEIMELDKFWPAENYHQDYLVKNPNGYCPDHSTGVAFVDRDIKTAYHDTIRPLGGKEIVVIGPEIEGTCLFCLKLETEVTSKYSGSIVLRTAPASALQGFNLITETWAAPTIFFIEDGKEVWANQGFMDVKEFYKALGEFKLGANSESYNVAFNDGTDRRYCKQYEIFNNTPDGVFVDKLSGRPLFDTDYRFNSKSGWLSFTRPVTNEVYEKIDYSFGMVRTEIRSVSSDIHLGHVFNDGPDGLPRYCINATVLEFVPRIKI